MSIAHGGWLTVDKFPWKDISRTGQNRTFPKRANTYPGSTLIYYKSLLSTEGERTVDTLPFFSWFFLPTIFIAHALLYWHTNANPLKPFAIYARSEPIIICVSVAIMNTKNWHTIITVINNYICGLFKKFMNLYNLFETHSVNLVAIDVHIFRTRNIYYMLMT